MSSTYQSLYRKYRPVTFSEIIGQRHVTQTLANAVASGRIAHAYLFCGPRGTGKTTTARALAMALNCENGPIADPCRTCDPCVEIRRGSCLDVIEFDAASHRSVEDIEDLRHRFQFAPGQTRYKVYIIDEVHQLSDQAFDMLLKVLEEPPAQVVFVLATTETHKVKPTILSRCQRFDFHRVSVAEMQQRLHYVCEQEELNAEPAALAALASAADGAVRDALSLLDQAAAYAGKTISVAEVRAILGGIDPDLLLEFGEALAQRRVESAFAIIDRVVAEGKDLAQLLKEMIRHLRDVLLIKLAERSRDEELAHIDMAAPQEYLPRLREQAQQFSQKHLVDSINLFCQADAELRATSQQRLILELCVVRACTVGHHVRETTESEAGARPVQGESSTPTSAPVRTQPSVPAEPRPPVVAAPHPSCGPTVESAEDGEEPMTTLEKIRKHWPAVLDLLAKDKQVGLRSFMLEVEPIEADEQKLVLAVAAEFAYDMLKIPEKKAALETIIAKACGVSLKVELRLDKPKKPSRSKPPAEPKSGDDPLLTQAMDMFPGSEVM